MSDANLLGDHDANRATGAVAAEVLGDSIRRELARGLAVALAGALVKLGYSGPWLLDSAGNVAPASDAADPLDVRQQDGEPAVNACRNCGGELHWDHRSDRWLHVRTSSWLCWADITPPAGVDDDRPGAAPA